jgi:hypothetical protein
MPSLSLSRCGERTSSASPATMGMKSGSSAESRPWRTKKSIRTRLQLYLNSAVSRTVSRTRRTGQSSKEWTSPSFAHAV